MDFLREGWGRTRTSCCSRLKTSYDEEALVKMLIQAMEAPSTAATAGRLQEALFKYWKSKGKSIDDVFNLLKLKEDGSHLFTSPAAAFWASYAIKLNDDAMLYTRLWERFDDVQRARMVADANNLAKSEGVKTLTGRLLNLQFKIWFNQNLTPNQVATKVVGYNRADPKVVLGYLDFYKVWCRLTSGLA